jgi:hypothetical protein
MTKGFAFLAGFAVAAAAAGAAWWLVLGPRWRDHEDRAVRAERLANRAKRDAVEAQQWAETEQRRRRKLEEEKAELVRAAAVEPPRETPAPRHNGSDPSKDAITPEEWDRRRIGFEIEKLTETPARVVGTARYANVVRALKAKGEEGYKIPVDVLQQDMPVEWKAVCATLLGALGDPRGVPTLLATWKSATDAGVRRAALRGLANLPGDEATPILEAAWHDPTGMPLDRLLAIHGLARRMHETALAVVAGGAPISSPALRYQAMRSLHARESKNGWADAAKLVPVFGKALRSADGEPQRELALLVLEGFWSKDSVEDLDAFVAAATPGTLVERARSDAASIRAGKPRPAGAGEPAQKPAPSPVDDEPIDADSTHK